MNTAKSLPQSISAPLPLIHSTRKHRRGAVLVLAAFLMIAFLALVAFAVDLGYLMVARTEMQRAADAAALAASWELVDEAALRGDTTMNAAMANTRSRASEYVAANLVGNDALELDANSGNSVDGEIVIGYLSDLSDQSVALNLTNPSDFNAVQVRVRKTTARNGQVPFFFSPVLGVLGVDVEVQSTAAVLKNIGGFRVPQDGSNLPILPITLDEESWNSFLNDAAPDDWGWDEASQSVTSDSDGVGEINIYPQDTGASGNSGTVNIGTSSNSTSNLSRQIHEGISPADLNYHGGELNWDQTGGLTLSGDPGISNGIADALSQVIGEPRMMPIFRTVTGTGSTSQFTIVKFVGVRIVEVQTTGGDKRLMVQPVHVQTKGAVGGSGGDRSDFIYSGGLIVR